MLNDSYRAVLYAGELSVQSAPISYKVHVLLIVTHAWLVLLKSMNIHKICTKPSSSMK